VVAAVFGGVLNPAAFAVGFEDVNPMGQSIQQSACEPLGTDSSRPTILSDQISIWSLFLSRLGEERSSGFT